MRATGIIAEYNPFHHGHAYQLAQARAQTGADYVIIAMSGDFTQRGTPAIADKYTRARMALLGGADLVLEIPAPAAVSSAEYYARAGVRLLGASGVVDTVCYGCESVQPELLSLLSSSLLAPDDVHRQTLKSLLCAGKSFPFARQEALCASLPENAGRIRTFLSSPNNILALEYEKAIAQWNRTHEKPLTGCAIQRIGDGYHCKEPASRYASASALRRAVEGGSAAFPDVWERLAPHMPHFSLSLLRAAAERGQSLRADDFSGTLYAALLAAKDKGYERFADVSPALSRRIANHLYEFVSWTQFSGLLKTRDLTYTRVSRTLSHIMLGFTPTDCLEAAQYLRVLGFRSDARPLLSEIHKKASAPMITRVADASRALSGSADAMHALKKDLYAADLYRGICSVRSGRSLPNEYTQPLVVVPPSPFEETLMESALLKAP